MNPPDPTNGLGFLRLLQVMDSQFPVGNFAHSAGLETYAALGISARELQELLANEIELGWGRLDLAAASLAWTHAADQKELGRLGETLDAWKVVEISRTTSIGLGRRMLALAERLFPDETAGLRIESPHQAVVIGALARRIQAPLRSMLLAYGQSQLTASLSAAVRCMALSAEHAQEIASGLHPALLHAVARAEEDPEGAFFASVPALDIRRFQQPFLSTRLFKS